MHIPLLAFSKPTDVLFSSQDGSDDKLRHVVAVTLMFICPLDSYFLSPIQILGSLFNYGGVGFSIKWRNPGGLYTKNRTSFPQQLMGSFWTWSLQNHLCMERDSRSDEPQQAPWERTRRERSLATRMITVRFKTQTKWRSSNFVTLLQLHTPQGVEKLSLGT